jgi:hypothetical protein
MSSYLNWPEIFLPFCSQISAANAVISLPGPNPENGMQANFRQDLTSPRVSGMLSNQALIKNYV